MDERDLRLRVHRLERELAEASAALKHERAVADAALRRVGLLEDSLRRAWAFCAWRPARPDDRGDRR